VEWFTFVDTFEIYGSGSFVEIERKKKQKVSEIILEGIRKLLIGKRSVISIGGDSLIGPNA
jgi:hypothetical protein